MKYKLVLDKNNYLRSIEKSYSEDGYELDIVKMNLDFINCYKLVNDEIIFDEEKYDILVNKNSKEQEMVTLKQELATYDYIGIKISMGVATKEEYADKIAYTETLREKIRELENELK